VTGFRNCGYQTSSDLIQKNIVGYQTLDWREREGSSTDRRSSAPSERLFDIRVPLRAGCEDDDTFDIAKPVKNRTRRRPEVFGVSLGFHPFPGNGSQEHEEVFLPAPQ
jgi:hypothetical protein